MNLYPTKTGVMTLAPIFRDLRQQDHVLFKGRMSYTMKPCMNECIHQSIKQLKQLFMKNNSHGAINNFSRKASRC